MGSSRTGTVDEPGAWDSREFLRSMVVGKVVEFKISRQASDRYYGQIVLDHTSPNAVKVNIEVVKNGHATVKSNQGGKQGDNEQDEYQTTLAEAETAAKNSNLGVHGSSPRVRALQSAGSQFTIADLAKETKGRKIKVIIEHCFDGGRYRVEEAGTWRR